MPFDLHIDDAELMLAIDGELPRDRTVAVQEHLSHCWTCRARRTELERSIEDLVHLRRSRLDPDLPPAAGPAAQIRARMAEESTSSRFAALAWKRLAIPAAIVICIAAGIALLLPARRLPLNIGSLPDPKLTPGAVRVIAREQVCDASTADAAPSVPLRLASQVFEHYGIANPKPRAYEVDYLVGPELGGAPDDVRNLWPQPYENGIWNAHVKDALEDHLRRMVCEGSIDLATAQAEIAGNWIHAYQKHFRSRQPIAAHALFIKDQPWE